MIILLGASGFVGQAFADELRRRGHLFIPLTRKVIDYHDFDGLFEYVHRTKPRFIINAAGYPGTPEVDACELARKETLVANALLPQTIARVCLMTNTPWGHVSSGNIYSGAKVINRGRITVERNFNRPELRRLLAEHPEKIGGFTEWDEPNFSFRHAPCNFYSGTKALAEEAIRGVGLSYIWRPGVPFNDRPESGNFLWKLQCCQKVYDGVNSVSHLGDFVGACLDLWERQALFGTYNVSQPGAVTTRQIIEMIKKILKPNRQFEFWQDDEEFYRQGSKVPRSNCLLDVSKLLANGIKMRPAQEALEDSLRKMAAHTPAIGLNLN